MMRVIAKIVTFSLLAAFLGWALVMPRPGLAQEELGASRAPLQIIYPTESGRRYDSSNFEMEVLRLALNKSGVAYNLLASDRDMTESRSRAYLEKETGEVTIAWYGTSRDFEQRLRPIRIPIARGLLGYRLFLIHRDRQPTFSAITSLDQLAELVGVQGSGWSDVEILSAAGLKIITSRYKNLFPMIDLGRADYFPRGANEAFLERATYQGENPNLAVEQDLVLIYPFAKFFFVSKSNAVLAEAIERGWRKAYQDGSYMRLFNSHPSIREVLDEARLDERRQLVIDNPLLSEETKAIEARFWYANKSFTG